MYISSDDVEKHGVDFADAVTALDDLTVSDPHPDEGRFVTIGTDALGRIVVLAYTWREGRIRPISARRATRRERRQYEDRR